MPKEVSNIIEEGDLGDDRLLVQDEGESKKLSLTSSGYPVRTNISSEKIEKLANVLNSGVVLQEGLVTQTKSLENYAFYLPHSQQGLIEMCERIGGFADEKIIGKAMVPSARVAWALENSNTNGLKRKIEDGAKIYESGIERDWLAEDIEEGERLETYTNELLEENAKLLDKEAKKHIDYYLKNQTEHNSKVKEVTPEGVRVNVTPLGNGEYVLRVVNEEDPDQPKILIRYGKYEDEEDKESIGVKGVDLLLKGKDSKEYRATIAQKYWHNVYGFIKNPNGWAEKEESEEEKNELGVEESLTGEEEKGINIKSAAEFTEKTMLKIMGKEGVKLDVELTDFIEQGKANRDALKLALRESLRYRRFHIFLLNKVINEKNPVSAKQINNYLSEHFFDMSAEERETLSKKLFATTVTLVGFTTSQDDNLFARLILESSLKDADKINGLINQIDININNTSEGVEKTDIEEETEERPTPLQDGFVKDLDNYFVSIKEKQGFNAKTKQLAEKILAGQLLKAYQKPEQIDDIISKLENQRYNNAFVELVGKSNFKEIVKKIKRFDNREDKDLDYIGYYLKLVYAKTITEDEELLTQLEEIKKAFDDALLTQKHKETIDNIYNQVANTQ